MVGRFFGTWLTVPGTDAAVHLLSASRVIDPDLDRADEIEEALDELGLRVRDRVPPIGLFSAVAELLAIEQHEPDQTRLELFTELLLAPAVVVEESSGVARALGTLASQVPAGGAWMVEGYDSLLLFVAYETAVAVVWFAAGPAQAMRTTVTEVLEPAFLERFQHFVERRQERWRERQRRRDSASHDE